jgi:hypothetical protein
MTEGDLRQIAGYLEGEGTFSVDKPRRYPRTRGFRVSLPSKDKDALEWLQSVAGGYIRARKKARHHHSDMWQWRLYGHDAINLAKAVRPFMAQRRKRQIDAMLMVFANYRPTSKRDCLALGRLASALARRRSRCVGQTSLQF